MCQFCSWLKERCSHFKLGDFALLKISALLFGVLIGARYSKRLEKAEPFLFSAFMAAYAALAARFLLGGRQPKQESERPPVRVKVRLRQPQDDGLAF